MTAAFPHVAVLMATYNGAEFLPQQLDSLAAQIHENWRLWVSDDGSADATLDILRSYQEVWGYDKLRLLSGPGQGFQANFFSLTARPDINANYYAWSDQDDVWLPFKLARALERLGSLKPDQPALYCGRTILIDRQGRDCGYSPSMSRRPPSFANALMQSLAGGNTMVFNQAARELIAAVGSAVPTSHDWWAYQVASGCGGQIFYDSEPMVRYRQHGANCYGKNRGLAARCLRLYKLLAGHFKKAMDRNLKALETIRDQLTPGSRRQFDALSDLRRLSNPFRRLVSFLRGSFHRQAPAEQLIFYLAVLVGRI